MAVPDTTDFTLQDVTTEIHGDTAAGRSLDSCFANAIASSFDSLYSGAKDRLSNFRNYSSVNSVLTIYSTLITTDRYGIYVSGSTATQDITVSFTLTAMGGGATGIRVLYDGITIVIGSVGATSGGTQTVNSGGDTWYGELYIGGTDPAAWADAECVITGATVDGIPFADTINVSLTN